MAQVIRYVTIPSGQSVSDELPCEGFWVAGVVMPAAWTAANLTVLAGDREGGTFLNVYDKGGTEYTITADASRHIVLNPHDLAAIRVLKLRSGTAATPVNQAADRRIGVVLVTVR